MRISDWSSDVCSSDLALRDFCGCNDGVSSTSRIGIVANALRNGCGISITDLINECRRKLPRLRHIAVVIIVALGNAHFSIHIAVARGGSETRLIDDRKVIVRSEERRVGKECVSKFRTRWCANNLKTK